MSNTMGRIDLAFSKLGLREAFIAGAEAYIILGVSDDRAGAVMMGIAASFVGLVIATAAAVLERVLQGGVELQAEHDLTV